jgi:hypothetical protein
MNELNTRINNFIMKAGFKVYLKPGQQAPEGRQVFVSKRNPDKVFYLSNTRTKKEPKNATRKQKVKATPENDPLYINNFSRLADIYNDPKTPDEVKQSIKGELTAIGGDATLLDEYFEHPEATWIKYVLIATTMRPQLEKHSTEVLKSYVEKHGIMGDAKKPIFSVSGSPINYRPSKDCARFCYAYGEKSNKLAVFATTKKGEIIDILVNRDPDWVADKIAVEFKEDKRKVSLHKQDKALRFFDRGEGSDAWIKVIKRVNEHGIRAHVFSKRPEFLEKIDKRNVRLLSIDASNAQKAEGNSLPVAFVYSGDKDLPLLEHLKDRIQVVLPVKSKEANKNKAEMLKSLPDWSHPYICPVDAGGKEVGTIKDYRNHGKPTGDKTKWNCPNCDVGKGLGCYRGQATQHGTFDTGASQKVAKSVQLSKQINSFIKKYSI